MVNNKSDRKKLAQKLICVVVLIVASLLGINVIPTTDPEPEAITQESVEGELEVHMIDVGQADSILFVQNNYTALIDCGTRTTGKDVVQYLKELGITKLDFVFGTHPHDDHMGGMYDVITNFEIGKIVIPKVKKNQVTSNWYLKLMNQIETGGYEVEYAELGNAYELGKAIMKVIGPITLPESNLNNYSTVLKVSFGEMDVILTGDAEKNVEKEIIATGENLDAEILKLGHHGSDTSTSDEFLNKILPQYALISAKVGNKYQHPIKSTMDNLKERNIIVYRTDENGTVVATITEKDVEFNCKPGDYLSGIELEEREEK